MKWYKWLLVLLAGCVVVCQAELSEEEIEDLQDELKVRIGSVSDDDFEEDDVEYQQLKFYTYQAEDSPEEYTFRVKVTMELTEKKKKTSYFVQFARTQGEVDIEYTGEDNWQFVVPFGDLEKPKVTAYVIEYGIIIENDDGKQEFIALAVETDDVDTVEELTTRSPTRLEQKPRILHQYSYRDSDEEVIQSMWE